MNTELIPFSFNDVNLSESCWIDGKPYFTRRAVGEWLQYPDPKRAIAHIIHRNPHIEDDRWSGVLSLSTPGGVQEQRVFDPVGLQLIIMESRQPKAKAYKVAVAYLVSAYMRGEIVSTGNRDRILSIRKKDLTLLRGNQHKVCPACNLTYGVIKGSTLGYDEERKRNEFNKLAYCRYCGSKLAVRVDCYLTMPETPEEQVKYGFLESGFNERQIVGK